MSFERCTIDELTIEDAKSFRHIELYADLERVLRKDGYTFRVLPEPRWDRALFLNLTYWAPAEAGDVLVDRTVPADVVAHVAWHHLATRALAPSGAAQRIPISALFLGEAIASAFDLYLVGRILGRAPKSSFLATQVEAMAETADAAGLPERDFEKLLEEVADDPERAFADLRQLLVDATAALMKSERVEDSLEALVALEAHRFGALLHRYELSNWLLYARAYGSPEPCAKTAAVEKALRDARDPLAWLVEHWVRPAL
jgi:hypothetical protein